MKSDVRHITITLLLVFTLNEFCVHGTVLVETPTPKPASIGEGQFNLDCIISPTANERLTKVTWMGKKKYDRYYRVLVEIPISLDGAKGPKFRNHRFEARSEVSVLPGNNGRTHVRLTVGNVTCQDEGSYKCRVNVFGGDEPDQKIVNVTVTEVPMVYSITQKSGYLIEHQKAGFECTASVGKPAGKLEWRIMRLERGRLTPFPVSGRIRERMGSKSCSPMAIGTMEHEVDFSDKVITCVIVREANEFPKEKQISVQFSVRNTEISTMINGDAYAHWLKSIDATEGDNVVFTCSAKGHPQPKFQWRHVTKPGRDSGTWLKTENGTLFLDNVSKNHTGAYVCTATNTVSGQSQDSTKEITLNIKDRPTVPPTTTPPSARDGTRKKIMSAVAGVGVLLGVIVTTICGKCCGG